MKTCIQHPILPFYRTDSRFLILGSFPSVKSREQMFFYGHPQNRFWPVISGMFGCSVPVSVQEKKALLQDCKIAVWDVIASCEIAGSSDSSIKKVVPNDISVILEGAQIEKIFVNGKTAEKYYNRYIKPKIGITVKCLPSTSPANASWSLEKLTEAWRTAFFEEDGAE